MVSLFAFVLINLFFRFVHCAWFDKIACIAGYCCNPTYIPANISALERELKDKLYGQHLVIETLINALTDHWETGTNQKALTLSFHGPPGTGKNYVTSFIRKHLYKHEAYIHLFNAEVHFPYENEKLVPHYKKALSDWIKGNLTHCGKQIFIFDEVEKMPAGVLDAVKPFIDYHSYIDRHNYHDSIFIFLSNTGEEKIIERFLQLWNQGLIRDDLKLVDFEEILLQNAFNDVGGFYLSDNIKSNLIDHYIPFLPLEQKHVRMCVLDEFKKRNIFDVEEEHVQEILNVVSWGPEPHKIFSKTGCKRISQKVGLFTKSYSHRRRNEL